MNYIGSKIRLSDFIVNTIKKTYGDISKAVFAELFAGTGIISRKLKNEVNLIIANDFEYYSYILLKNYIDNKSTSNFNSLIDKINNLKPKEGFIFNEYSNEGKSGRNYFTPKNAKIIDAARLKIQNLYNVNKINDNEYTFLLCSLLESADKVANTASVYGAYLKHIKKSASKKLIINPAHFEESNSNNLIYNEDANRLITKIKGDILYLDPPYNARQYGANYHLLNTIAEYKLFTPRGITGLPEYKRSDYCVKNKAYDSLDYLINNADFSHIFLSYNNEGILSLKNIKELLSKYGKYQLKEYKGYQRFKADRDINRVFKNKITTEYLHILKKK